MQPHFFNAIPLEGVKGVLIDLDDTLYIYEAVHQAAMQACYQMNSAGRSFDEFSTVYRRARTATLKRLEPQGCCRSRFFAFQDMAEAWQLPAPYVVAAEWEKKYWDSSIEAMTPDTEALAFLKRCDEAGLPVCIVSDMTAGVQVQKLRKLGVEAYVHFMVTSEEVGAEKPDPRMFQAALTKLKLSPTDVIMVGDNPVKDIQGAGALGIKGYLIQLGR